MWVIASAAATATELGMDRRGKLGLYIQPRLALPDGACLTQERCKGNCSSWEFSATAPNWYWRNGSRQWSDKVEWEPSWKL